MRKKVSCICLNLEFNVSKEHLCSLMRRKKILLAFVAILICLTLFFNSLIREVTFYFPILSVQQNVCDVSSLHLRISNHHLTTIAPNKCWHGDAVYGNFCVISPYSQRATEEDASVTLTTQGTVEYLHHVVVLCRRWAGPISVAVFTPPDDYSAARQVADRLRDCDFCIRRWVSWHFFHYNVPMPSYMDTEIPKDCKFLTQDQKTKKRRSDGIYPINVGRNLARAKTNTPYVFPIDIELYPSAGILPKFERMLHSINLSEGLHVWVLPVFEVFSKYRAPITKGELKTMFAKKQAISFHQYRCNICHKIPNLTQWINNEESYQSEVTESLEALKVWTTVKRSKKYQLHVWEPFFIGTRDDPEFDIRLSWEGRQNKMQVAFEMCLMDYNFHIIENAFLVHSPGISIYNASEEKFRDKYSVQNNKLISTIRKDLIKKYGPNKDC